MAIRRIYAVAAAFSLCIPNIHALERSLDSSDSQYYQFLDPIPQGGGKLHGRSLMSSGTEPAKEDQSTAVSLSTEEIKERANIRSLLRLVDGETVPVSDRIYVQLLGVQFAGYADPEEKSRHDQLLRNIKKWIGEFMDNPELALRNYEGMNSQINYNAASGNDFSFYYLYVPDFILEEVRREGLSKYEDWLKRKKSKKEEREGPDTSGIPKDSVLNQRESLEKHSERPPEIREYVISEAKYYYDDGGIKKEEIYKDGKLGLIRHYDPNGRLSKEEVRDPIFQAFKRS